MFSSQIGSSHPPELPEDPLLLGSQEFRLPISNESVENRRFDNESLLRDPIELIESLRPDGIDEIESLRLLLIPRVDKPSVEVFVAESLRRIEVGPSESLLKDPIEAPRESFLKDEANCEGCKFASFTVEPRTNEGRRRLAAGTGVTMVICVMESLLPGLIEFRRLEGIPREFLRPWISQFLSSVFEKWTCSVIESDLVDFRLLAIFAL